MDPGGSELDSSLPQPENPCLIVEDSQPDSVGLEDDPESSYRALLARRLSSLQPTARSPVLVRCGSSQFGFLALSQSQDLQADTDFGHCSESKTQIKPGYFPLIASFRTCSPNLPFRSEVSSSSTAEPQLTVQALLHSQNLQASQEPDQQDGDLLSSQQDLFDADKSGNGAAAVDSTVSEPPEQQAPPTSTPASTLRLLHLSGQGALAQDSLSQSSVDFVAPTPDDFTHTPLIVPSSPTEAENEREEPMDTSLPPEERAAEKDEPMETEASSRPRPATSTPVSLNSSGLGSDRALSVPSQPEFSHVGSLLNQLTKSLYKASHVEMSPSLRGCFVKPQSRTFGSSQEAKAKSSSPPPPPETQSQLRESAPFTAPLQLSPNANSNLPLPAEEDSQATQIEELEEPPGDSAAPCHDQEKKSSGEQEADGQKAAANVKEAENSCVPETPPPSSVAQSAAVGPTDRDGTDDGERREEEAGMEEESGGGASGIALVLSQSQLVSPEPMEEEDSQDSVIVVSDSEKDGGAGPGGDERPANGQRRQSEAGREDTALDGSPQTGGVGREAEGVRDKSLNDSGDISFHFTLPKEGELIGPAVGSTPPLINQLKQTLRHSTPIDSVPFAEKPAAVDAVSPDAAAAGDVASGGGGGGGGEDAADKEEQKLSLRMKLVTPVEEGSSERFSLQSEKPPSAADAARSRLRLTLTPRRFPRLQPGNQSRQRNVSQQTSFDGPGLRSPAGRVRTVASLRRRGSCGEPESPSFRRTAAPAHRRHVRTVQEVRTTITRIITDVYYEDGREVDRRVTEESEEPVVDCQVLDDDVSPCRTGSSSVTSGDLADVSSLSSKASSLQHSSGTTGSSTGPARPDFLMPPSRGFKSIRYRLDPCFLCTAPLKSVCFQRKPAAPSLGTLRSGSTPPPVLTVLLSSFLNGLFCSSDNLVEGKRRRRSTPGGPNTPSKSSSSSPRTPGPSGKRRLMSSEESRLPSKRGRRGGGARAGQRVGVCNTSGSGTDLPGRSCDVAETHGPLPQNASLFMGFAFMLTASSEVDRMTNKVAADYVQTGPYNKPYTESQLQAGGGFILPDFNEEQCKAAYQSLLIADQHCRTRKYLLCLASGVPCVSHIWVRDCCKENKLLNYRNYLLPAGVGPDDAIVEWHPRSSPFKALRFLLLSQKPDELWAQLATMGGASSVRQVQTDEVPAGKYDVVVADPACPPALEKSVTSQEVPMVSAEWLIQSVICGERLGFSSRPQYRHDYAPSPPSSSSS
uniref:Tumor protein p53 binding protein, 1 n=1 Tax=Fundulus heteroclitus TaxID=8078 RepID=A0A3Q2TGU2_FUNHE